MSKDWGPITWYLFHTLAEKIKDEHFIMLKVSLLEQIFIICSNLPCPDCANHARQKMLSLNRDNIKTKSDLKKMLLMFHNEVNTRNKKTVFSEEDLNEKYSKANLNNIVNMFFHTWTRPNPNPKLLTVSFHKGQSLKHFTSWWSVNKQYFNN
jgi:hypothetical protein